MDVRRLRMLLELSRLGSMHEVAGALGTTTSSVSQGIAALARDVGSPLLEPDGRRVRLTPAGRRLADHAVTILAAVESARLDLDPTAEPVGVVRVAGFASAIRRSLLPAVDDLRSTRPGIEVRIHEYEPLESLDLLARDDVDLALAYDYDLAPAEWRDDHVVTPLWDLEWGIGVPTRDRHLALADLADRDWIVNSRHTADEDVAAHPGLARRLRAARRAPHRLARARRRPRAGRPRSRPPAARTYVAARGERRTPAGPGGQAARLCGDPPRSGPVAAAASPHGAAGHRLSTLSPGAPSTSVGPSRARRRACRGSGSAASAGPPPPGPSPRTPSR